MAFSRRSGSRFTTNIWPGFVDAMTALLLVLMFVLSIFMIVQSILATTVSSQEDELTEMSSQVASLAEALGLEQQSNFRLEEQVGLLGSQLDEASEKDRQQAALIASLTSERDAANAEIAQQLAQISSFEDQVASLLARNSDLVAGLEASESNLMATETALMDTQDELSDTQERLTVAQGEADARARDLADRDAELSRNRASLAALEAANAREISQKEALQLALARARDEIVQSAEAARLAAARREAMEALIADLRAGIAEKDAALVAAETNSAAQDEALAEVREAQRLAEARRQALEALVASLRDDVAAREADLEATRSQLADADADRAEMRAELGDRDRSLTETLLILNTSREELAQAEARLANDTSETLRQELRAQGEALTAAEQARAIEAAAAEALRRQLAETQGALSEAEARQLADMEAAERLRQRLQDSDAELTAMQLNLEEARRRAEETLIKLAAAETAEARLREQLDTDLTQQEQRDAMVAIANDLLDKERRRSEAAEAESRDKEKRLALLNQQAATLTDELNRLQGLLDAALEAEEDAQIQISALGQNLNTALARVAAEQRKLAEEQRLRADEQERIAALEAERARRLEEEAQDLRKFRSDFFREVGRILEGRDDVQVVGDRFVFSSEVLFQPGSARLGAAGQRQIARVAAIIRDIAGDIPDSINWILRVDGHTDNVALSGQGEFRDNWELSQARALSVVKYLTEFEGLPANRLAATGFGEFQPIDPGDSDIARARNRRIELKFTER